MSSRIVRPPGPAIIVALDYPQAEPALSLARRLDPHLCRLKVGKELFTAAGPAVVAAVQALGFEVFLDLKFHDIPNTVAAACRCGADLGVWMLNVHAGGGEAMLAAAREAVQVGSHGPLLIAVTVLTSLDEHDLAAVGVQGSVQDQVLRLASLSARCGLDGVVCAASDLSVLRDNLPPGFLTVTPGVRPRGSASGDQKRVTTPRQAIDLGAGYLVIGRPISQAPDPARALESLVAELNDPAD